MELLELMRNRRSVRKYTDQKIEKEKMDKLLQAAMLVPSGHNFRPIEFIVVEDPEMLKKLSAMRATGSAKMLEGAAAAIVVIGDTEKSDMWVEDASVCMQNIYVMAEELGLGVCWIQGRARAYEPGTSTNEYVRELLGYPENMELACTMAVGYPAADPAPYKLEDLDFSTVHYEKY